MAEEFLETIPLAKGALVGIVELLEKDLSPKEHEEPLSAQEALDAALKESAATGGTSTAADSATKIAGFKESITSLERIGATEQAAPLRQALAKEETALLKATKASPSADLEQKALMAAKARFVEHMQLKEDRVTKVAAATEERQGTRMAELHKLRAQMDTFAAALVREQEDLKQKHAQRAEERKKFQTEVLQLFDARIGEASAKTCGQVGVPSQATSSPADTQLQEAMKKLAEMEKEVARMKQEAHAAATSAPTRAPQHYTMNKAEAGEDSEEISDVDLLGEVDPSMLPDSPDPVQGDLPILAHAWLLGEALPLHPVDVPVKYAHYGIPLQGLQALLGTATCGKYHKKKQLDVSQVVVPRTIVGLLHVALDRIRERLEVGSAEAKAKAKQTVLEANKEAAANRKDKRAAKKKDKEPGASGVQNSGLKA